MSSAEETAKFDLLKKQRAAFKGQLTYFKNRYNSATTLGAFESLLRRVQLVYDKYGSVQLEMESMDDTTGSDRDSFEDEYGKVESMILNKIHELKKVDDATASVSFQDLSGHESSSIKSASTGIRLPELKLPSFSGVDSEWLAFRDVFVDLIHSKAIEPTVKFVYLISHIRSGSAYSLIENLPVTAENYETAWKTICERYNNEAAIQKAHMREIYNVRAPQENSSKSLQAFIDHVLKHYNSLKWLKVKVHEWDLMLSHHLIQSLDNSSRADAIKNSKSNSVLSFNDLIQILRNRVQLLQALQTNTSQTSGRQQRDTRRFTSNPNRSSSLVSSSNSCSYCAGSHLITQCPSFNDAKLTPQMRFQFIRHNKLCTNCLILTHNVRDCTKPPCALCSLKHNIRLHFKNYQKVHEQRENPSSSVHIAAFSRMPSSAITGTNTHEHPSISSDIVPNKSTSLSAINANIQQSSNSSLSSLRSSHIRSTNSTDDATRSSNIGAKKPVVMIGTALVNASTSNGNHVMCRAVLDSGSHMNFVTREICNVLQAKRLPTFNIISGIGGKEFSIKHKIYLTISSRVSNYKVDLKFYVIPKITSDVPSVPFNIELSSVPVELKLADPHFNVPDRIDLLLGVEVYNQLFKGDSIKIFNELPPFYSTELGYVVCGKASCAPNKYPKTNSFVSLCSIQHLESQMKQFWELETIVLKNTYSQEEKLCEEHFCKNVKRLQDGRYSVSLPLKSNVNQLGSSRYSARSQFVALEKRLRVRHNVYQAYREFMAEYISLGHMVPVVASDEVEDQVNQTYYLPHHYVLKDTSTTTKLRVVFNASAKTTSQLSLNDCLMVGPTIQQNLFSIILRFRKHIHAFCGDIAKMYRQIHVNTVQQYLQRIWWRDNSLNDLQSFKLCTVTYGTASAPFLATRTLQQLSLDEHDKFPLASKILVRDFYVDDVLTGCSTLIGASKLKTDLISLLKLGGFELRKFASNVPSLSSRDHPDSDISLVLGLTWNTENDSFETRLDKLSLTTDCTKRIMLSEICRLFDPLGFCAPIIVTAKLFMQTLWVCKDIGWDDRIPDTIAKKWICFKSELQELKRVIIPRCIIF